MQIGTDILLIIARTSDELFNGVNIDDLKWPWTSKIESFNVFSCNFRLSRTFQDWIVPKMLKINLENLRMNFFSEECNIFNHPLPLPLLFTFCFPFPLPSLPTSLPLSLSSPLSITLPPFPFPFPSFSSFLYPSPFSLSFLFPFPSFSLYLSFLFSFPFPFHFPSTFLFPSLPLPFLFLFPSFFPCLGPCVQYLRRHISITVQDRRMVTTDLLLVKRWWRIEWSRNWQCLLFS